MKNTYDLSKIEYKFLYNRTADKDRIEINDIQNIRFYGSENVKFNQYEIFKLVIYNQDKKYTIQWATSNTVHYTTEEGIRGAILTIDLPSMLQEGILDNKDGIYNLLADIFIREKISFSVTYNQYEMTRFGDEPKKPANSLPSIKELIMYYFQNVLGIDFNLMIKEKFDLPIKFKDIEYAVNMELREQILKKFGYEKYIKEGVKKGKILYIVYEGDFKDRITKRKPYMTREEMLSRFLQEEEHKEYRKCCEKIILMESNISFLEVQDSSTNKTYFLKIPPQMTDIQEAKAWTFGLEKEEYNPKVEA